MSPERTDEAPPAASPPESQTGLPRVLMLGLGWFPAQVGGLNRYYRGLLEHLPETRGVVVGPAPDAGPAVSVASGHEAPLPLRLARFWLAARRVGADVDIVDAHFALYALPCLLLGPLRRRPLVVHFHGPWADENAVQGDAKRWRHRARASLEKAVYRRAHAVVTLSAAFRRLAIERYGVIPWSIIVQPPGIDLARFSPGDRAAARERLGIPDDVFAAACVRRLVPRMGLSVLIEAWEEVPGLLLIAGDGELRPELERLIESRGLATSVRLLGRIDDDALVDLYRAADLNVVPSVSFEGFGLVVAEAGGCGTPSVVTRVGGLPEAVSGLADDLVVEPGDAQSLRARLQAAAEGARPSRDAVRAWAERYAWSSVAAVHRELYSQVLAVTEPDRRLRVVYLDHVARLSGGEIALQRMLPWLAESVDAHVILGESGPLVDRLIEHGSSVEVLPMGEAARGLRKDSVRPGLSSLGAVPATVAYVLRLSLRLRRLQPDVVHANSLKAGVYGGLAARLAGVPMVWHVRDMIDRDYLPRSAVALLRVGIPLLSKAVVTNSESTLRALGPRRSRVHYRVAHEVVDAATRVRRSETDADALRIGIVGRLAPWKGQEVFLDAFALAFPADGHRAVIIGSALFGEDSYARSLEARATALGIGDRVEFRGFRDDVMKELAELDILVHASITPEPFGKVILEGLAAGLPVLAAADGGPSEIITDGVDGLLYPSGDAAALAALLRELSTDADRRMQLARAGRRRAKDFDPATMAAQVTAVYEAVKRGPSAAGRRRSRRSAAR